MKELLKILVRKNKYIEALVYVIQNNVLHKYMNFSGDGTFSKDIDKMYKYAESIADLYAQSYGNGSLAGKTVLEIGTGMSRIAMLVLIKKYNVRFAYTYDRFCCLHKNEAEILEKFGLNGHLVKLTYLVGGLENLQSKVPKASIDYIVSNAVLEHVDNLEELISCIRTLQLPGSTMFHRIDLRCHNRFKSHGELYFHTFSNRWWNLMGNNVGHPNRKLSANYFQTMKKNSLNLQMTVIEKFPDSELARASIYLRGVDIRKYENSIIDIILS